MLKLERAQAEQARAKRIRAKADRIAESLKARTLKRFNELVNNAGSKRLKEFVSMAEVAYGGPVTLTLSRQSGNVTWVLTHPR